ncbi:hypothetical protein [Zooshikella ganghwensis]|uniref:Uncharacterized protein n=1 Tax=Zooshikella ganghwensis TaxID=202772 RepID=A0A4P9VGI1_9GAMM|nr:hypothetical protein [Zooshikella ganghwensis]RDH41380.1 hypothetical protein B9G39_28390 [Zooshikella ganghwensis]
MNSPGGKVSFYVEVWGDTLTFLIDGEVQGSWNTTVPQRKVEFDLPVGRHELAWVYSQKKHNTMAVMLLRLKNSLFLRSQTLITMVSLMAGNTIILIN